SRAPQFDFTNGQLVVPHPPTTREKIQEPFVREQQIDPKKYYPKGYHPHLLEEWPVKDDLVVPMEALPDNLKENMGAAWRQKQKNQKVIDEQNKK
ncbi:MAG: MBL fold metallo-hydrolase, partial [Deltaproteobacteria bacterium]|nr:MBL fold metallo-hydrolase [Deltaproteobacteria bacterium]